MKASIYIFAAIFFGQISKIEGFLSDDEDLSIEGSDDRSGSGSGCYQIPTNGDCTCNTLYDCLQTCSDTECDLALEDCLGVAVYGNCKSRLNSTITSDDKPKAISDETILVIVGSVVAAIFLTATIIILTLRKKECCCTRTGKRGNESKHAEVYQPQLLNYDRKTTRLLINPVDMNAQENSRIDIHAASNMVSFSTPKLVVSQNDTCENDYQEMPDINRKQNGGKSDRSPAVSNNSSKLWKKANEENQGIQDIDQNYQNINPSTSPCHLQTTTNGQRVNRNDPMPHYQPMDVTGHYLTMTSSDVHLYTPMAESGVSKAGEEYAIMGDSVDHTSNVYVNNKPKDNLYDNETVAQPVADYINVSGKISGIITAKEDDVYEEFDN